MSSIKRSLNKINKGENMGFILTFRKELIDIHNGKNPIAVLNRAQRKKAYKNGILQGSPKSKKVKVRVNPTIMSILFPKRTVK